MQLIIKGDIHYALYHFALYGAAAILQESLPGAVIRINWLGPDEAALLIEAAEPLGSDDVARILHDHARGHTDSWVQATHQHRSGKKATTVGTFSPRLPLAADADSWRALQTARHALIDEALEQRSWLDLAFMHALGEPAYWYLNRQGKHVPDVGSSGWEMKTRNRGEEFMRNRLSLLADSVTAREPQQVLAGLLGDYREDEVGRNSVDSRTPTGLRPPYPTDNALAWIALWGISCFPVVHRATDPTAYEKAQGAPSITTAQLRGAPGLNRLRRAYTVLPHIARPMRLSTLKSVLVSGSLARLAAAHIRAEHDPSAPTEPRAPRDAAWLRTKGVGGLMLSVLTASDNPNAPELAVTRGQLAGLP